jgi:pimeloyl-ACP methyl ester carboxylesterase
MDGAEHGSVKHVSRTLSRLVVGVVMLTALTVAAGVCYERFCIWRAWRAFPPPGKLVEVMGRRIQLDCRGSGTPVVVFEAGLDINGALSWSPIHDAVARATRACAYSRAGIMWSDPREGAADGVTIARDLHALLANAGERPPFVLVGHSLGGLYVVAYTTRFPSEVAGLVLVESAHPEQVQRFKALVPALFTATPASYRWKVALGWTGIMRIDREASTGVAHQSSADVRAVAAFAPSSLVSMLGEEDAMAQTLDEARSSHDLGDRPTWVLTGARPLPDSALESLNVTGAHAVESQTIWKRMQDDEASWSSHSQHRVVPDAGHYLQFDQPEAVIAAVASVVDTVRSPLADERNFSR